MKVYMLVSGYLDNADTYSDYSKTVYATRELAAWAFEHRLKDVFENDDVKGDSFEECVRRLCYSDGGFEMFVDEYDVIGKKEEAVREEEMLDHRFG